MNSFWNGVYSQLVGKQLYGDDGIYVDGLVQEGRNSIANALELCLYCTNPAMWLCKTEENPGCYLTEGIENLILLELTISWAW